MLGKYKILSVLGHGGMGNVYAAEDPVIKRKVAIKVLPPEFARDKSLIDRLLAEAQAAGKLTHSNVVTIFDVNHADDAYFIVMELVPGGSVQDYLAKKGSPGWRAATKLVGEACKALQAAHDMGLIHRDIKPSNLMLTSDGHVKVADFGLAKVEASDATMRTQPRTILGTPAFMSPEQCRGDKVDLRSDIYSLGCTYYAILTGKPPFEAPSSMQVMFAHCSAPIPDPRAMNIDAPEGVVEILQKALAKNPEDRYSTAKAMLADLRAVLSGASTVQTQALEALAQAAPAQEEVYEPPPMPEVRRPHAKLPGWVLIAAGAFVGMLVIVVLGIILASSMSNRRQMHANQNAARHTAPKILTEAAPVAPNSVPIAPSPATAPTIESIESASKAPAPALAVSQTNEASAQTQPIAQSLVPAPKTAEPTPVKLDPLVTNSIGQKLILCNAGTFIMGDKAFADAPPHPVKLTKPFYIGEYEVTQGELAKVLGAPPNAERIQHDELPAAFTSWEQATLFCRHLSEMPAEKAAGRVYRLPTEAEWEYACRAGSTTRFAFGDQLKKEQANFGKDVSIILRRMEERRGGANGGEPPPRPTQGAGNQRQRPPRPNEEQSGPPPENAGTDDRSQHPLEMPGSYLPNAWGIYDMHGSVWEWCSDFYAPDAYKHEESTDPTGPTKGNTHVARGGCWSSYATQCASAYRNGKAEANQREPSYGFRVVCEITPSK